MPEPIKQKIKNAYRTEFTKDEVRFARQFDYSKAIEFQKVWSQVKTPKAKNFLIRGKKLGFTDYAMKRFIDAKRGKY